MIIIQNLFSNWNFLHFFSGLKPRNVKQGLNVLEGNSSLSLPSHSLHFLVNLLPHILWKVFLLYFFLNFIHLTSSWSSYVHKIVFLLRHHRFYHILPHLFFQIQHWLYLLSFLGYVGQKRLNFMVLSAHLKQFQFFWNGNVNLIRTFKDQFVDAFFLFNHLFLYFCLVVLQFAFVVHFHLFFQVDEKFFLLNLGFWILWEFIGKYLDRGYPIPINLFHCADAETGKG